MMCQKTFVSKQKHGKRFRQKGAIFVEMTLALPLLVVAGFNMLDLWQVMREKHIVVEAVRAGGRWAVATQIEGDTLSDGAEYPAKCDDVINSGQPLPEGPLDQKTAYYTCTYLTSSGLNPAQWSVNSTISESNEVFTGLTIQTIDVGLEAEAFNCLGCLRQLELVEAKASARFDLPFPQPVGS